MSLIGRKNTTTAARGSSASRFSYHRRSAEEVKERANRQIGVRDSYLLQEVDFFTPPAGDNIVRILPPSWDGARHYGLDLFLHYSIGPDKNAYLCLDKMKGEACPICEERQRAAAANEEELSKMLRPRSRVLVWMVNRKEEGKGPLAWSMPAGLDKDIVNCSLDQQTGEFLAIDDPTENGYDISFKRIGTDERTEYSGIVVARRSSPLSDNPEIAERWLEFVTKRPLPSLLIFRTYDEISASYAGTTTERREDKHGATAASAAAPAAPASKLPARRAAAAPTAPAAPDLPTWDEVHALDEAALEGLIGDLGLDASKENFKSEEQVQDWICGQLKINAPTAAPAAAGAPAATESWKEKLARMRGGK